MRGFGASSVSHQHGKGTKCLLFQGIFLGKGLWGKVGHRHVVRHHAVWGKIPGKMPLGKSATVVSTPRLAQSFDDVGKACGAHSGLKREENIPLFRVKCGKWLAIRNPIAQKKA